MLKGDGIHNEKDVGDLIKELHKQQPDPIEELYEELLEDNIPHGEQPTR